MIIFAPYKKKGSPRYMYVGGVKRTALGSLSRTIGRLIPERDF